MIEVSGLSKRFGAVEAVRAVSFSAADGEITGLLGPNGAGKSSTLRMVYGVIAPDAGRVLIDGLEVRGETAEARARLGVLPHATGLYAHLTARENVAYYGALYGLPAGHVQTRIERLAQTLGFADVLDRRTKGFSQGQRIKVALARALVHDPKNLVLDEPTNGLDVMAVRTLRELLQGLRAEGRCILFSSHVMQEVAALCDRVVIIGGGRVLAAGTPEAVRAARGSSNLEEAFLDVLDGGARVDAAADSAGSSAGSGSAGRNS